MIAASSNSSRPRNPSHQSSTSWSEQDSHAQLQDTGGLGSSTINAVLQFFMMWHLPSSITIYNFIIHFLIRTRIICAVTRYWRIGTTLIISHQRWKCHFSSLWYDICLLLLLWKACESYLISTAHTVVVIGVLVLIQRKLRTCTSKIE